MNIMGLTKTETYSETEVLLAQYAKALGHPARIAILKVLLEKQSCICGDIVVELPLSQSTVSQHLKELKSAGIITGEIDGPKTCYCIDANAWSNIKVMFNGLLDEYDPQENCC
jgi:ArsR family transcriptional regulator